MIAVADLLTHVRARSSESDYLTALELAAVAHVERGTGRYYGSVAATTEYIEGNGTRDLWLAEAPAASPAPVVTEAVYPGATTTTIDPDGAAGYLVRGLRLVRKNGLVWSLGYEYAATYTRGYAPGSEPADIRHCVKMIVAHWYERRIPMPKVGENLAFPVPLHAQSIINANRRLHP